MNRRRDWGRNLGWIGLLWLLGCATRELPTRHAASSPLNLDAAIAPLPSVSVALDGEPPLEGAADAGWSGLQPSQSTPASAASHSHTGHGGHGHAH